MLALEYTASLPRYAAARVSRRAGEGALRLTDLRPPPLPGPEWMAVRPRLSGICGSDQALLAGTASTYLASLTSGPFVPGHEVVGQITSGPRRGERVVIEPALGCSARGIAEPCPECAEGLHALCRNVTEGDVSAGLQVGYCRATGGGWSEGLVAHSSQLHTVPDDLTDEDAVLVEPLACALHAATIADPQAGEAVGVIGAGAIGLLVVAALRRLQPRATVLCVAKYHAQELEALRLGADHTCTPDKLHLEGARLTGARRLVGHLGRELLLGGFDTLVDCIGTGASIEQAVTCARPRGKVVLAGMPGQVSTDLALAWQRELRLQGAYGYRRDFPAALELARSLRPGRLVAYGWPLKEYRHALDQAPRAARSGGVRTVFDLGAQT